MSKYKRTDGNQKEIVAALRDAGYYTIDLSALGHGVFDQLVACNNGIVVMMEIKTPGGKLTPGERKFYDIYPGLKCVVHGVEAALMIMLQLATLPEIERLQ